MSAPLQLTLSGWVVSQRGWGGAGQITLAAKVSKTLNKRQCQHCQTENWTKHFSAWFVNLTLWCSGLSAVLVWQKQKETGIQQKNQRNWIAHSVKQSALSVRPSIYLSVCLSLCLSVSNPRADPIPIPIQIQIPYSNLQFLHTFISFGAVHSLDKWSVINAALKGAQPSTPRAQPRSLCLSHSAFMLNDT